MAGGQQRRSRLNSSMNRPRSAHGKAAAGGRAPDPAIMQFLRSDAPSHQHVITWNKGVFALLHVTGSWRTQCLVLTPG